MKKFFVYNILILGLFLLCLSTSLLIKKTLNLDGDYLSAFASLVAVMVAFLLFNDWREQHTLQNLEALKISLHQGFNEIDIAYNELLSHICDPFTVKNINLSQYSLMSNKLNLAIESFCLDINHYERIIKQLKTANENLTVLPNDVKEKALSLYETLNPAFKINEFNSMIKKLQPILLSKNEYTDLKVLKIHVTDDMQKIILDYLKK